MTRLRIVEGDKSKKKMTQDQSAARSGASGAGLPRRSPRNIQNNTVDKKTATALVSDMYSNVSFF